VNWDESCSLISEAMRLRSDGRWWPWTVQWWLQRYACIVTMVWARFMSHINLLCYYEGRHVCLTALTVGTEFLWQSYERLLHIRDIVLKLFLSNLMVVDGTCVSSCTFPMKLPGMMDYYYLCMLVTRFLPLKDILIKILKRIIIHHRYLRYTVR
jgi:hypothetical protein